MPAFDFATLTDDQLNAFGTAELRAWADAGGYSVYSARTSVASVDLTAEVIDHPGALTVVDKLVQTIRTIYGDREPRTERRYGTLLEVTVWSDDDNLRSGLRSARDRAVKRAQEDAAEAAAEETTSA